MKSSTRVLVGIAVIAAIGTGWYLFARSKTPAKIRYETADAIKGDLLVTVSGSGNVVAAQQATINPDVSGEVQQLSVRVGDHVDQGQTLFTLKNTSVDITVSKSYASYLQTKQSVENAQAQVLDAKQNLANLQSAKGTTSTQLEAAQKKITAAQLGVNAATQNRSAAWAEYTEQKNTAGERVVKAPISGTITVLTISNGDTIGGGGNGASSSAQTAPVVIADLDHLQATIDVNEIDIAKIKQNQKATMTFDAITDLSITGKVDRINLAGVETQGVVTYATTISFDTSDKRIHPQMSVQAAIATDRKEQVLMVPNSAIKSGANSAYVEILDSGATAPRQQDVTVGIANDTMTEITGGISEGDHVVTQTISSAASATPPTQGFGGFGGGALGGGGARTGTGRGN